MSFIESLKQVGKIGVGYLGGGFLMFAGLMLWVQQQSLAVASLLLIPGFLLLLFGVYSERQHRKAPH